MAAGGLKLRPGRRSTSSRSTIKKQVRQVSRLSDGRGRTQRPRTADHRLAELQMSRSRAEERHRLGVAHEGPAVKKKTVALQSAPAASWADADANIICGPSLTRWMYPVGRPEVHRDVAAQKFDEKTLELKDQPAIDLNHAALAAVREIHPPPRPKSIARWGDCPPSAIARRSEGHAAIFAGVRRKAPASCCRYSDGKEIAEKSSRQAWGEFGESAPSPTQR